jgi:hypothetical protein
MKIGYMGVTLEITTAEIKELTVDQLKALFQAAHETIHKLTKTECKVK